MEQETGQSWQRTSTPTRLLALLWMWNHSLWYALCLEGEVRPWKAGSLVRVTPNALGSSYRRVG